MVFGLSRRRGSVLLGSRPGLTTGINNLLMLISVYLFAAAGMKTPVARLKIRHPMLNGVW
jgi:hypothetical protein